MADGEILVCRHEEAWCVRCEAALFERMARKSDAVRVARAHARAAARSGVRASVRVAGDRRPVRD